MNRTTIKNPAVTVTGHFDGVENGSAFGWVFDSAKPDHQLHVEILYDGDVVAFGTADQFRADLVSAGIGDGNHFFCLPISYELMDGGIYDLAAREVSTGSLLHGGTISFGPEIRTTGLDLINRKQGLALLAQILSQPKLKLYASKLDAFSKLYRIGALAQETGRLEDARYAWEALLKALGDNALCHCKLGETYLIEKNPTLALNAYHTAATIDLQMHWAHIGIAHAHRMLGQDVEAEQALEVATYLQPNDASLQAQLQQFRERSTFSKARSLLKSGNRHEAIEALKTILKSNPLHRKAKTTLSEILTSSIKYDDSLPDAQKIERFQRAQLLLDFFLKDIEKIHAKIRS